MQYLDLILNLTLLVALSIISGFIEKSFPRTTRLGLLLQGLLFGGTAILGMLRPVILSPGLIFDGRSVMLSLCALFFGPVAVAVATAMTLICRVVMGGVGATPGVLVILSSTAIGLAAYYRFKRLSRRPSIPYLYFFGCVVHLSMVVMMLSLPDGSGVEVAKRIFLPVILFYPFATILTGKILLDQVDAGRAEVELRNSEELFRNQFELHSAVKMIIDPDTGAIIDANAAAERYYGWTKEQLKQMKVQDINTLPPEAVQQEMAKAKSLHRVHFEFRHRLADGSIRDVEVFSSLIDVKGQGRLHSIIHDITERKQVEKALQESEAKYRRLFETMAQGVIYQDSSGAIISANPAAERILGLSLAQMRGKTSMDPHWKTIREDGSELPGTEHPSMVALRTGKTIKSSILGVFNPQKNDYSWLSVSATPLFEPGATTPIQVSITFEDITELRKVEHEYQMLFHEMLDGFALHEIICDEHGKPVDYRFIAVNPAFERMTGLKAKEVIGKTVSETLPGTEKHWIETYGHVALTGEPAFFENYTEVLDKFFEVTAFRPAPNQFACIFTDVTVRKRAETERTKLQEQLIQAQKMESVGRLAGGVAHDFNNMLAIILGNTEMALDQVTPTQPLFPVLQEIRTASVRSANLTRQLLAFARKQAIAPQILDLNVATGNALMMLRRLIGENIELIWTPAATLWPVKIDPSQLEQILTNLCVNARDAITGVGKITIETRNNAIDDHFAAGHPGLHVGDYVTLTIRDTGCGMAKQTLNKLFEPFFTTKDIGKGTGLGLAMVYGIVKQNDGYIAVSSEIGKGTLFTIHLPRHITGIESAGEEEMTRATAGGNETILIVEDEEGIKKVTQHILERLGYNVMAAAIPHEAIDLAASHPGKIDLLLTDVVMPEMNGRTLAGYIQAIQPGMKCLYMSGFTADVIAHQGVLDDGIDFLSKPFTSKALAQTIRTILDR